MKVILIRHGEIDSNLSRVYSGRSQEPLNGTGRSQAQAVAMMMKGVQIDVLYTSPLHRTRQTAQLISQMVGVEPVVSESFNELQMGPWEGLSESDVAERYPAEFALWNSRPADLQLPGRESLAGLQARVVGGIGRAFDIADTIAVVTHVAVIRVLLLFADNRSLNDYKAIHVPNAAPVEIDLDREKCEAIRI